jgi:hypothetical protein
MNMKRNQILDANFKTESHHYSVVSDLTHKFWQSCEAAEVVCERLQLDTKLDELGMFHHVKQVASEMFPQETVSGNFICANKLYVHVGNHFLIHIKNDSYRHYNTSICEYTLELMGSEPHVREMRTRLDDSLRDHKLIKISWHYQTSRGTDSASLHVTGLNQNIKDAYYPWFSQGVNAFISDYFDNPASVLVLYGPPGTGKTSFLRHLLLTQGVNAIVTYDDKVLSKDEFFVNYLTDTEHDALIVEDADVFLTPREDGENTMMSKFLNVSDGLIKITNKKMIFTTNITQLNKIDSALLRPGRCFEAVEFRELTTDEAVSAAQAAGVAPQDWSSQRTWSLAQIFNHSEQTMLSQRFRMGFTG